MDIFSKSNIYTILIDVSDQEIAWLGRQEAMSVTNKVNSEHNEVIIIGGGIIGTTLAYWLTRAGAGVTLLEAQATLAGPTTASFASAGMLSPAATQDTPPPLLALMSHSLQLYPDLIASLEVEQTQPTGYLPLDQLRVALNGAEVRNLQKRQAWYVEQGIALEARWLTPQEVAEIEPLVGPNAGAIHHRAAVVRAAWLTRALAEASHLKGAIIRTASPVVGLVVEGDRVQGVRTANGDRLYGDKIVVASGAWAGKWLDEQLAGLGIAGPSTPYGDTIWPVRGQMFSLEPSPSSPPLRHLLAGAHGYAFPRPDGSVVYGATVEPRAGFEAHMTPAGYGELARLVHKLTPALENAPVKESWAGLRPGSANELPLLGPLPSLRGLWLSVGHFRSGILLAPASAERLSQALLSDDPSGLIDFASGL